MKLITQLLIFLLMVIIFIFVGEIFVTYFNINTFLLFFIMVGIFLIAFKVDKLSLKIEEISKKK